MVIAVTKALTQRQIEIIALLRETGRVTVDGLAAHFGVTPQTVRYDLNDLSDVQMLVRVHGGAIVATGAINVAHEARKLIAGPQKQMIGEAVARLVPDSSSIFLTVGTTVEEVARALGGHSGLLAITNNLQVAVELHRNPGIEVVVTGGNIRQSDGAIVGQPSETLIQQFRLDFAILGTSGIDADGVLLDFDSREIKVARAMIEHARRVVLVTDSSKFDRSAPERVAHLDEIDILVTDRLTVAAATLCRRHGVHVVEAAGPAREPRPV